MEEKERWSIGKAKAGILQKRGGKACSARSGGELARGPVLRSLRWSVNSKRRHWSFILGPRIQGRRQDANKPETRDHRGTFALQAFPPSPVKSFVHRQAGAFASQPAGQCVPGTGRQ